MCYISAILGYDELKNWESFLLSDEVYQFVKKTVFEKEDVSSLGLNLHLDVYNQKEKNKPVVIFCHGLSTCSRMMGSFAYFFYQKGYHVICPDLKGFGLSQGEPGSGSIDDFVTNLLDVIELVRNEYEGPIFLAGISLGGILTYYTACETASISAAASIGLVDLTNSNMRAKVITNPSIRILLWVASQFALLFPSIRLPIHWALNVNHLSKDEKVINFFKESPLVVKSYTLKAIRSFFIRKPKYKFDDYQGAPLIVLHGEKDDLIPHEVSVESFNQLKGEKKFFSHSQAGHVPDDVDQVDDFVSAIDRWFKRVGGL